MKKTVRFLITLALLAPLAALALDAPKIREIKAANETLWQFLTALPASMEAQIFYGLMLAGLLGMVAHYFKSWVYKQIEGSLARYLFIDHPRRTLAALLVLVSAALGALASNVFMGDDGQFVGWLNVMWNGALAGFGADAVANKGSEPPA
jgi:hypothetical protein